jgi:hypothetical protein
MKALSTLIEKGEIKNHSISINLFSAQAGFSSSKYGIPDLDFGKARSWTKRLADKNL